MFDSLQETVAGYPAVVLAKEAVYNAVCAGAFELHDYLDFSSWFRTALLAVRLNLPRCQMRTCALTTQSFVFTPTYKDNPCLHAAQMFAVVCLA